MKTNLAPSFPPSSVSPIPKSIIKWRIPAVRWYISPERRTHTTSLASGLVKHSLTSANPCSEASDLSSPYSSTAIPKNRITPVILCKMEEIAVIGSFIVLRSRFTGRWLFTAYSHLESPKLQGELSGRHLVKSTRHHRSDDRQHRQSLWRSATEYSAKNTRMTTQKHSPKCALLVFDI